LADNVESAIEELIDYNIDYAANQISKNKKQADNSIGLMVMVIAVGAVFALVLGLIISNGISKPITKVVAAAGKLAEGDMDITLILIPKMKQENLWMLSEIWSKVRKSRHL